jgi:hypothetical protein
MSPQPLPALLLPLLHELPRKSPPPHSAARLALLRHTRLGSRSKHTQQHCYWLAAPPAAHRPPKQSSLPRIPQAAPHAHTGMGRQMAPQPLTTTKAAASPRQFFHTPTATDQAAPAHTTHTSSLHVDALDAHALAAQQRQHLSTPGGAC